MPRKLFVVLLLVATTVPALAQQPQQPAAPAPAQGSDQGIQLAATAVQMDVLVSEKNGRRVTGLTADDFQVLDENAAETVDYFAAIEGSQVVRTNGGASASGGAAPSPASPLATPYQGRHVALVFDDMSLHPENFIRSKDALGEYIDTKLGATDMAAVLSTGGQLGSLQQFTNDKQRLKRALDRIATLDVAARRSRSFKFRLSLIEAVRIEMNDDAVLTAVMRRSANDSLANQLGSGDSVFGDQRNQDAQRKAEEEALKNQIRGEARGIVAQGGADTRIVLQTLSNLFRAMADLPGRKIVVLLTETLTNFGTTSNDVTAEMNQAIDLARRGGVSVYALDAAGLRTNNTKATERITANDMRARDTTPELMGTDVENLSVARSFASGTGGQLFANTNDILAGVERAVEDSGSYYVLGFMPAKLDNQFHRLTVTVKNRPDLVVRTRRGYLAVNPETVAGTNTELLAAVSSPLPRIDLPLSVVANVVPKGSDQIVLTGLHVGRNYLTLPATTAADQTAVFDVLAYVFAVGKDQPVGAVKRTVTVDLAADPTARERLKTDGFVFVPDPFGQLAPGMYQVRAVVREKATGAVGSGYQFFEVPDLAQRKVVSLSSVVLSAPGKPDFTGRNSFKAGTEVDMRFIIYNPPRDATSVVQRIQVTDSQGRPVLAGDLPMAPATADGLMSQQSTRLAVPKVRGRYGVVVTVSGGKQKLDLERRTDFVVE
jgi:VWFA-related protein